MESTGSYWIPVKNILEGSVEIVLVCPRKHKPERGDKTDFRDARNRAHLHRHGLLTGSFVYPHNGPFGLCSGRIETLSSCAI
jgi:transposase